MPLRDVEEFSRWIALESPSVAAQRVARHFLAEIGDEAWRSPSVPIDALSNQPEYEVREVALQIEGENRPVRICTGISMRPTWSMSSPSPTGERSLVAANLGRSSAPPGLTRFGVAAVPWRPNGAERSETGRHECRATSRQDGYRRCAVWDWWKERHGPTSSVIARRSLIIARSEVRSLPGPPVTATGPATR